MAHLIDVDAFLSKNCIGLKGPNDGEYDSCSECLGKPHGYCCMEVKGDEIYNAPTIDAIPVEWLQERKHWAAIDGDYWAENIIGYLLDVWQKEQEAR